jgi:hypothetical protein
MNPTKDQERDLEAERQELLAQMDAAIHPDLKRRIEQVVSIAAKAPQVEIATSHSGAADAEPS